MKISWFIIGIYLLAGWLLMWSLSLATYLSQPEMVKQLITIVSSPTALTRFINTDNGNAFTELMSFDFYASISLLMGMVLSFVISLLISRKSFWINPVISFCILYLLFRFTDNQRLRYILITKAGFFSNPILYLSVSVLFLFVFSFCLFLFSYKLIKEAGSK